MTKAATIPARLRIPAQEAALDLLFPWLAAEAERRGVAAALRPRLHLALEEAVSNIVRHGFAPGQEGAVAIALEDDRDGVRLVIEDDGARFDPAAATPPPRPATLAAAKPGGAGLALLRHACDGIAYEIGPRGNCLTLSFRPRG
ncbi:MAG: ATP-binding protein [Rhodospirillales bacterium]|nr:ATP-binding protein [Rhodospirillales bacterium]